MPYKLSSGRRYLNGELVDPPQFGQWSEADFFPEFDHLGYAGREKWVKSASEATPNYIGTVALLDDWVKRTRDTTCQFRRSLATTATSLSKTHSPH